MRIVVCIKQVPDTTEVKLDPKTNTLIREGVPSIINHDDKAGLEMALQLREQLHDGTTVKVICMGPPQAGLALREALAMGCDDAVLVSGPEFAGSDTYATASILAAALSKMSYDLIITGRQAIDGDTAQVGPQIAEQLGIPQVTYAEDVKLDGDKLLIRRQFEDRYHLLRVGFPCLISALSQLATPRYMTVNGVVEAYRKQIPVWGLNDLKDNLNPEWIGLKGSPTKVVRSFPKQSKGTGVKHTDLSVNEAVDVILAKLTELHLV